MKEFIEELYKLKENNTKDKAAKLAIAKLIEFTKDKVIDLDKTYFVSEWSWNPWVDGNDVHDETIRDCKDYGTTKVYCTCNNYRTYLPWDIYESREDCQLITDFKNSFGYDWDIENGNFLSEIGAYNSLGQWR